MASSHRVPIVRLGWVMAIVWNAAICRAAVDAQPLHFTGTVEPAEVVDVCARVSGFVAEFGPDPRASGDPKFAAQSVDFLTPVKTGALLARLDDAPFRDRVALAKADLAKAEAELERARSEAELAEARGRDAAARHRAGLEPGPDLGDLQLKVARANARVAEAGVAQAKATLAQAERDLDATRIVAPVDGIIIDRRINQGQSVPGIEGQSLFLIARTPLRLQVWAAIPETLIGRVHRGQSARITVSAFPDKAFIGTVQQIRLNATMTRNTVSYTTVIQIDGDTAPLLPYLTADVTLATDKE